MNLFQAALLGIVEGISEFLPISSTAHLLLASSVLGIPQTEFQKMFEVSIQSGAILSVLFLYARDFLRKEILLRIFVAFVPTAIIGFLLHDLVKNVFFETPAVILWSLLIGGMVLIAFDLLFHERGDAVQEIASMPLRKTAFIGVCQALAIIPGVSRSAATIVGGLLLGVSRSAIIRFSFLLAVPTIAAATILDLLKTDHSFTLYEGELLLIGFVMSFIVALICIRLLDRYFSRRSLFMFGCYRVILAVSFFAWFGITAATTF